MVPAAGQGYFAKTDDQSLFAQLYALFRTTLDVAETSFAQNGWGEWELDQSISVEAVAARHRCCFCVFRENTNKLW